MSIEPFLFVKENKFSTLKCCILHRICALCNPLFRSILKKKQRQHRTIHPHRLRRREWLGIVLKILEQRSEWHVCKSKQLWRAGSGGLRRHSGSGYQRRAAPAFHRGPAGQRGQGGSGPGAQRGKKSGLCLAIQPDYRESGSGRRAQNRPSLRPAGVSGPFVCRRAAAQPRGPSGFYRRALAGRHAAAGAGHSAHGAGGGGMRRNRAVRSR